MKILNPLFVFAAMAALFAGCADDGEPIRNKITSVSPAQAHYGETVTIEGRFAVLCTSSMRVTFNGVEAEVVSADRTEVVVVVPKDLTCTGDVTISSGTLRITAPDAFTYLPTYTAVGTFVDLDARVYNPVGLAVDVQGKLYVAQWNGHLVRKVTPSGEVSTFAGSGTAGYADGTGTAASFARPVGLAFDKAGDLYVADRGNNRIRKITPAGEVSTFAGSGTAGYADGTGTAAQFHGPNDLTFDPSGNLYVTEVIGSHRIRKITPAGVVSTVAGATDGSHGTADGQGTAARFYFPYGAAVGPDGNLYVGDMGNHRIRKVTPDGAVSTLTGSDGGYRDGSLSEARFNQLGGIAFGPGGMMYVCDAANSRIRAIGPDGTVSTFAGSGTAGVADGLLSEAQFQAPMFIVLDAVGNIFISDELVRNVRVIRAE